ncbi:MAG: hypothetical protein HOJ79_13705 [Nitrospina sp.]|jgi:hypothetical protein|nr:hypothetical protein [Nitrospina sp.]
MINVKILIKFSTPLLFAILFFSISVISADKTANPVAVTTHIAPDTFTLGDIATYTITVQHDKDIQPFAPEITPPKGLEFVDKGESPTRELNGQVAHEYWYKFRVDEVGKLTLPSISVSFHAPDQKGTGENIQGTILAPEATLEVQSLLAIQGGEGIHDIKPLHEISPPWVHYFWVALGVLALLVLFYFIWRKWKCRPITVGVSPATPVLTPEQLAYKELEALRVKGLLQIGRTQDHFFELSEIFRRYLENRFQFPAREWTTEEITAHFKHFTGLNEDLKQRARVILNQTDRIKFAKAELAEGQDEIKSVIGFIREACPPVPKVSKQS